MPEEVNRQIVRLEPDEKSAQRLERRVASIRAGLKGLRKDASLMAADMSGTARGFAASGTAADRARLHYRKLNAETKQLKKEARELGQAQRYVATETEKTQTVQRTAQTYQRVETQTRAVTGAISAAGGQAIAQPLNVGADIIGAVGGFKQLKSELPKLAQELDITKGSVALLAVGLAAGAAAALVARDAIREWSAAAEAARQAVQGRIGAIEEYEAFLATASSEEIRLKADELAEKRNINGDILEDLMLLKHQLLQGFEVEGGNVAENVAAASVRVAEAYGLVDVGLDSVNDAINKTITENKKLEIGHTMMTLAIMENAGAAEDNRRATESATNALVDQYTKRAQLDVQAARLSAESIRTRLAQIEEEKAAYEDLKIELSPLAATSDYAAEGVAAVVLQLGTLSTEADALRGALANAELIEQQKQAYDLIQKIVGVAQEGAGKVADAVTYVGQTADRSAAQLDAYREKMTQVEEDRARTLVREEADAALERTREIADHYRDLAKIDADYYDDRADIIADMKAADRDATNERLDILHDYNQESAQSAREHARRLYEIQRDAELDIRRAAARLDAIGIYEAQQQAKRDLDDEQAKYDEEQRQREESIRDTLQQIERERREKQIAGQQALRDLEQQHRKERDEANRAFAEEIQRADQDRRIKLQRQQEDWNVQNQRLRDQYGIVETATGAHYSAMYGKTVTGMANIGAAFDTGVNNIATRVQEVLTRTAARGISGGNIIPEQFATGASYVRAGTTAWVGEQGRELVRFLQPAQIYSAGQSRQMAGRSIQTGDVNVTFSGDIGSKSPSDLTSYFKTAFKQALGELVG